MGSSAFRQGAAAFSVIAAVVATVVAGPWLLARGPPRIPAHLLGHPFVSVPELFDESTADALLRLAKEFGTFPTNVADTKFYSTANEHIGEAQPIRADGICEHPFLVPNSARTECILPGRIDIGRHYILSGGTEGLKEEYESLVSRVQSFGVYLWDLQAHPVIQQLFASDTFTRAAGEVCPPHKQLLDPFQFNLIVNLPGQTVATHIDGAYFWGANRFYFPQWLLATMVFSGLFQDEFIDQVQVVGYFHNWTGYQTHEDGQLDERAGKFALWNSSEPMFMAAHRGSGNAIDGSKTVHAAGVYHPHWAIAKGKRPLRIDKSSGATLQYAGDDTWELVAKGSTQTRYTTDDLRMSIVYRARCFTDKAELKRHKSQSAEDMMQLGPILRKLVDELVKQGRMSQHRADTLLPRDKGTTHDLHAYNQTQAELRYDLAIALMDGFLTYPFSPTAMLPLNYCALGVLVPALAPLLRPICG